MKYFNSEELAKKIKEDFEGNIWRWYSFNINNSPQLRVANNNEVKNCTCKFHSVKDINLKIKCRYTIAFEKWKNLNN